MSEYKKILKPFLREIEGFESEPYQDSKGNPTIGAGLNLNDPEVRGLMQLRNIDPDQVIQREMLPTEDDLDQIKDSYLDRRETLVKDKLGPAYDTLPEHKKAAIMSLGYQSLNNIGPSLTGYVSEDDNIGAIKEMILQTNKDKDPGTLIRRLREAELYGGPVDFSSSFKVMNNEEKNQLMELIGNIKNEHTKKQMLEKYSPYLNENKPKLFNKINKLLTPELEQVTPLIKKP
jgi:GH24 family phage-related lysozyme (muramidase)